jgi:hypothetical protein
VEQPVVEDTIQHLPASFSSRLRAIDERLSEHSDDPRGSIMAAVEQMSHEDLHELADKLLQIGHEVSSYGSPSEE